MLCAGVELQAGHSGSADGVLGEHALNGQFHCEVGALLHELTVLGFLEVADPAGEVVVLLLVELLAGENGLVGVDDDDKVAAVDVGGEGGLVLTAEQNSGLNSLVGKTLGNQDNIRTALLDRFNGDS